MRRVLFITALFVALSGATVFAQTTPPEATELKTKINDHEQKIKELEAEIAAYEKELTTIGGEKRTLESAVREIDLSRKKVVANIQVEERKIDGLETQIADLDTDISGKEQKIAALKATLGSLLAHMNTLEEQSLVETFLHTDSIENVWDEIGSVEQVNAGLRFRVADLRAERDSLAGVRKASEEKHADRVAHQNTLVAQRRALDITQSEKKNLLSATNQKESAYQKLLTEKVAAKAEFEAALRSFESELSFIFDPTGIPAAGKGVLAWPLANVFVTQKFGNTSFAKSGAYNGNGHNGVDFRASVGTPVMSVLSGTVSGTGNTDVYRGCYSYGKWVLIRHANGLSTLYAHLSQINVAEGATILTGEVIGHSGNTGYSTGPHLHFTLYVSGAVQLKRLGEVKQKTNCAQATIPVAPLNAYLDPLEYL